MYCTGMDSSLQKLIDVVAEPHNNLGIFRSPSTNTWSCNFFDWKIPRNSNSWALMGGCAGWQAGRQWWWGWGWLPMAAVSVGLLAESSALFPVEAERCRWSLSQTTSRLMCVHAVFPYDFSFTGVWNAFLEGGLLKECESIFQWPLSVVSFILPCLALPDVCT